MWKDPILFCRLRSWRVQSSYILAGKVLGKPVGSQFSNPFLVIRFFLRWLFIRLWILLIDFKLPGFLEQWSMKHRLLTSGLNAQKPRTGTVLAETKKRKSIIKRSCTCYLPSETCGRNQSYFFQKFMERRKIWKQFNVFNSISNSKSLYVNGIQKTF